MNEEAPTPAIAPVPAPIPPRKTPPASAAVPAYIPMYRPLSASGTRRLKPRPKPYDQWTEEEWKVYDEHIREVRSKCGRLGGGARLAAKGKSKTTSVMCRQDDHTVLSAYAKSRGISLAALLHEMAEQILAAYPQFAAEQTAQAQADASQRS